MAICKHSHNLQWFFEVWSLWSVHTIEGVRGSTNHSSRWQTTHSQKLVAQTRIPIPQQEASVAQFVMSAAIVFILTCFVRLGSSSEFVEVRSSKMFLFFGVEVAWVPTRNSRHFLTELNKFHTHVSTRSTFRATSTSSWRTRTAAMSSPTQTTWGIAATAATTRPPENAPTILPCWTVNPRYESKAYNTIPPLCCNVLLWLSLKVVRVCMGSR